MHGTARNYAIEFLKEHEALVLCMYLDFRGLMTTGIGDLIDNEVGDFGAVQAEINKFTWRKIKDNVVATATEIEAEWRKIKGLISTGVHLKMNGKMFEDWARKQNPPLVTLQLNEDEYLKNNFFAKLDRFERSIKRTPNEYFKDFADFPADAQLGIVSIAWGNGEYFAYGGWKNFRELAKAQNWRKIVDDKQYRWQNINEGREIATRKLFNNAANVVECINQGFKFDKTQLIYPTYQMLPVNVTAENN